MLNIPKSYVKTIYLWNNLLVIQMLRCEECGHTAKCCEEDCPKCGGVMIDERDFKIKCAGGTPSAI
jgi:predicted Zn-ribbon and HTH transcriptional regulator